MAKRKMLDCRNFPSAKKCTVTICGSEDEILPIAIYHAITVHGHNGSLDLIEQIKEMLVDEEVEEK